MIEKLSQHLARAIQAVRREMHVVDKENDRTAQHSWGRTSRWFTTRVWLRAELRFTPTAGGHSLEEGNGPGLSINRQLELIARQPINKTSVFIDNRHSGLYEFSLHTEYVISCWRLGLLAKRGRKAAREQQ